MIGKLVGMVTGGWKTWALAGVVIVAVGGYIGWLQWDIAVHKAAIAQQEIDKREAIRVAQSNERAVAALKEDRKRLDAVIASVAEKARNSEKRAAALAKEIERVPQSENCVVGPAARRVIDGLFGNPEANRIDRREGDEGAPAGRTPAVPKRPR